MSAVVLVGRWGAGAESDFYPWLQRELGVPVDVVALPNPPPVDASAELVRDAILRAPQPLVVVGHSVGVKAALLGVARAGVPVRGFLGVAAWDTVDRPWPTIEPWIAAALPGVDVPRIEVLLSDDDPFTADRRSTAARFERELGARVTLCPGAAHFNRAEEPAVLEALRRLL